MTAPNDRDCFCNECHRKKGTGAADARWWCFMTIGGGLHVAPWAETIATLTNDHACGDRCAALLFAHYLATGKLEKPPRHHLPSFLSKRPVDPTGTADPRAMYCLGCGRESHTPTSSSALIHCPDCHGTNFGSQRPAKP
jgi:hypothetical protein